MLRFANAGTIDLNQNKEEIGLGLILIMINF